MARKLTAERAQEIRTGIALARRRLTPVNQWVASRQSRLAWIAYVEVIERRERRARQKAGQW